MSEWKDFFIIVGLVGLPFWYICLICLLGSILIKIENIFLKRKEKNK